jgi:hypothetical protein
VVVEELAVVSVALAAAVEFHTVVKVMPLPHVLSEPPLLVSPL